MATVTLDRYGLEIETPKTPQDMTDAEVLAYARANYAHDDVVMMYLRYYDSGIKHKLRKKSQKKTVIIEVPPKSCYWIRLIRQRIAIIERGLTWRR